MKMWKQNVVRLLLMICMVFSMAPEVPSIISLPTTAVEVQAHSSHHKTKYVYVTPTGRKYHTHKCGRGTYRKAKLSYAKSRGLTPCKKCY